MGDINDDTVDIIAEPDEPSAGFLSTGNLKLIWTFVKLLFEVN